MLMLVIFFVYITVDQLEKSMNQEYSDSKIVYLFIFILLTWLTFYENNPHTLWSGSNKEQIVFAGKHLEWNKLSFMDKT